ncbi:MAG TPA: 50S ribosomal protein L29 [Candidatus Limnocylindria bacterium]|nr:50S ribosomal protein L29 [Candidatus Limnocylindria bacterium]
MDIDKVRQMTDAELVEELANQRRHLYDLRFQLATRQLTDHSQLAQTRRGIARILTVLTERELRPSEARPEPAPPAKPAPRTRAGRASKAAAPAESEPAAAAATAETGGNR